ncbi:MAG: hypothetical protein RDU24_08850 [Humidesulfovibrio sp.]|uniref:hypothetical protein n=1 Tax=Humidesulfovibrio sp. TaxID=2910988 RepID=UPI0027F43E96|nr:hypothetical protein [Humidesulfovibrio sp.]MDQ7835476.1 hypothetical protein [Humidesulfovibrio sp.]
MSESKLKRKATDWEAVERQYCLGQLSNAEIGNMFGISKQAVQQKAKRHGWKQDLSNKVAQLARIKLSADPPAVVGEVADNTSRAQADDMAVQTAAEVVVQVVRGHRVALARLNALTERLMNRLDKHLTEVEQDTPEKAALEERKQHTLDLDKSSKMTAALAAALSKTIPLERQAFNVDGARPQAQQDGDLPESVRERLAIYER